MSCSKWILFIGLLFCTSLLSAQGTVEDYRRAYSLGSKFSAKKVYYSNVNPNWIQGTHSFWYVKNTEQGPLYVIVDADTQTRKELFDHQKMIVHLNRISGQGIKANAVYLEQLSFDHSPNVLRFVFRGKRWQYTISSDLLEEKDYAQAPSRQRHWMDRDDEKVAAPVFSPDHKYKAYIKNDNIYVQEAATGKERQLSFDGTLGNYYSAYIRWSPDSKKVASCKIRPVEKRYVYYVESSPADQLQPKLHKQEYAKPGDELPFRVPCIYEVETGRSIIPETALFDRQYELTGLMWNTDSRALTFEYNQRGHQIYRVLELSAETGTVRALVEETSDKYVNYSRRFRHDLKDGKRMIWMSERDNWNHLYMYDRATAQPVRQITKGEWYVREVLRVDEERQQIYFRPMACGKVKTRI